MSKKWNWIAALDWDARLHETADFNWKVKSLPIIIPELWFNQR